MIIHRSQYPDLVLPPKEVSLPEFIFHPLRQADDPSSSRLTDRIYHPPPSHQTYNAKPLRPQAPSHSLTTLKNFSNHFALHLLSHSFSKGDVLSLVTTNQHDLTSIVLGANSIGVIVALHNPGYGKDELKGQMEMVKTKGILASKLIWEKTRDAGEGAGVQGERIWTFEEPEEGGEGSSSWLVGQDAVALLQAPSQQDLQLLQEHTSKIDGTHDAVYCFSSGTSGKPKAVRLTQANLIANVIQSTVLMSDRFDEPLFDRWDAGEKGGWYDDVDLQKSNDTAKGTAGKLKELGHALKSKLKLGDKSSQANTESSQAAAEARPKEFHIDLLPQFHCYGLVVAFVALHTATPRVVLPRFDLQLFLHLVQERKATFAFVVPPIIQAILKSSNQIKRAPRRSSKARSLEEGQDTESKKELFDISSLTRLSSGATSLPTTLRRRMYEKFGMSCTDGYGMSEMSPIISLQTFQDLKVVDGTLTSQSKMDVSTEEASTSSSVGRLAPSTLARIIAIPDEESDSASQGEDLPADQPGELWLYGPQQMAGYLNNDSANSSTFVIESDRRRWLRTGDIVSLDSSTGHLRIHGRTKDVIKVNGFQVSPSEVEEIVLQHAGERVGDVAVVGVKIPIEKKKKKKEDEESTLSSSSEEEQEEEVPWAFVVPSSGSAEQQDDSTSKELLDLINPQLTRYKRLRGVTWVESLPRSEAGKVLKRELRDDFQKKRGAGADSK